MNYDPSTATPTDKVFVATMLKSILDDKSIHKGMPNSVYNYLEYTLTGVIDNINAEITLDIMKTLAFKKDDNDE